MNNHLIEHLMAVYCLDLLPMCSDSITVSIAHLMTDQLCPAFRKDKVACVERTSPSDLLVATNSTLYWAFQCRKRPNASLEHLECGTASSNSCKCERP